MTISGLQERPAQLDRAEPEVPVAAPPAGSEAPPPSRSGTDPTWTWTEMEEAEPPRATQGWITLFAWAKASGGW
ncbi:MAG TPA: hypothetical protein VE617_14440 [Propionibacteriaceae bacterium]|nr:hypothetical protein [Propionibacteriaceae bacterium]